MKAVGENCQLYVTNIECIVRRFAPLQVTGWKEIPRTEVEMSVLRVRMALHITQKFLKFKSANAALANPPAEVDVNDWKYLVNQKNKKNKEKVQFTHFGRTKSFSRVRWEHRNLDTGAFPSRIDTFKLTQYDEERNTWVDDDAKNGYDKMNTLHTNPPEELQHMSEDEIHDYVIGESPSGYIRGLGAGPKPRPSSGLAARRCA
ncbi:hypothetical protein ACOSP7_016721 [Xanthoceras sorbifolium]